MLSCQLIIPDSFILADYILAETADIIKNWKVNADRMKENVDLTRGLIFSQSVLLALTKKGMSREEAFRIVQKNSLKAWKERLDFKDLMQSDKETKKILNKEEVNSRFSLQPYLEKIDYIFDRVLG